MNRDGVWMKSSISAYDGNCLEVCVTHVSVSLRNSRDPDRQVLYGLSHDAFRAFIESVKADELLP